VALLALVPARSHAAAYQKYVSTVCPYTIQYPTTWSFHPGAKHDTFFYAASSHVFAQVLVSCAYGKYHRSIKALTLAVAHAYQKQGYSLQTPQYKANALGLFFGDAPFKAGGKTYEERLHVSTVIYGGRAWVMALAGDSAHFSAAERLYDHFLASFKPTKQ
jgi:hypothetical protein